ncbi:MAG: hypothetical protein QOC63_4785 [Mycobacterium sp.]|nr:hypothetical protein [Mycobacterium sp.]
MNTAKWFAIMVAVVVGEVLVLAAYVVHMTGTTGGVWPLWPPTRSNVRQVSLGHRSAVQYRACGATR